LFAPQRNTLTANSHEDINYLGITYDSNVTYWYQDGAVNWHRTVDGGEFNLTHTNTTGTVPAAPGSTATIPGTDSGRRRGGDGSPIVVTVCNQYGASLRSTAPARSCCPLDSSVPTDVLSSLGLS
jgi:hypothetical protein